LRAEGRAITARPRARRAVSWRGPPASEEARADGHDDLPPLLVGQRQQAEVGLDRLGQGLGDLVGRQRTVQDELARHVLNSDLDLHGN
jgi:hypothetical protein